MFGLANSIWSPPPLAPYIWGESKPIQIPIISNSWLCGCAYISVLDLPLLLHESDSVEEPKGQAQHKNEQTDQATVQVQPEVSINVP
jgi:hypothetical protein